MALPPSEAGDVVGMTDRSGHHVGPLTREEALASAKEEYRRRDWKYWEPPEATRGWRRWAVRSASGDQPTPWVSIDARSGRVLRVDREAPRARHIRWMAAGIIAIAVGAVIGAFLWVRICDEQITQTGSVVSVCRHVQATDPPVIVIAIVLLSSLGVFYSEVSGFGVTLKRKVVELEERTKVTQQESSTTRQIALENHRHYKDLKETAEDYGEFNKDVDRRLAQAPLDAADQVESHPAVDDRIYGFARQYDTLRRTMPSGDRRTHEMTGVVNEMRRILRGAAEFDVRAHLTSESRGARLAAYAYLTENEASDQLDALVEAVVAEDKPFGQYWGLLAIEHQTGTGSPYLGEALRGRLTALLSTLGPGTDRARVIGRMLAASPAPPI